MVITYKQIILKKVACKWRIKYDASHKNPSLKGNDPRSVLTNLSQHMTGNVH